MAQDPMTNEAGTRMFAREKAMQMRSENTRSAAEIVDAAETFLKFVAPPKSSIIAVKP